MNPIELLHKYYDPNSRAYRILSIHSKAIQAKALELAALHQEMDLDISFIEEASLLHDIGIFLTNAPDIDCFGEKPYICHGYLGADLLRQEGYPCHALVCERHTGSGISMKMIKERNLPLPHRDMIPVSKEEKLICLADKFFSKSKDLTREKTIEQISREMENYGEEAAIRFNELCILFLNKPVLESTKT